MTDPRLELRTDPRGALLLALSGAWTLRAELPGVDAVDEALGRERVSRVGFDTAALERWDTRLLLFVAAVERICERHGAELDPAGLPQGARRLRELARAAPARAETAHRADRGFLEAVGDETIGFVRSAGELLPFFGEVVVALGRVLRGRSSMRPREMLAIMQEVGAEALPIVSLISVLVGLILAYVGAIQLEPFGAGLFVANLVAIAMAREMAAMMTGIIMAGRTGASFAATLGTMTVNEEIDALRTTAIAPVDFLVLPRLLALMLMMPLLTVYSNVMGILGGSVVGVLLLDIEPLQYLSQTRDAVSLVDFATGLFKATVYGVIVAVAGCLRGLQCGRSAAAVGVATTSAVVTSIVFIVIASATFTVMFQMLGI